MEVGTAEGEAMLEQLVEVLRHSGREGRRGRREDCDQSVLFM
jgi:hypothetical protein